MRKALQTTITGPTAYRGGYHVAIVETFATSSQHTTAIFYDEADAVAFAARYGIVAATQ